MILDPIYAEIGSVIRKRRKNLKKTQATLAAELGMSRGSLANIEIGRQSVLVHQLYRFASALGLPVSDLLPPVVEAASTVRRAELPLPSNLKPAQKEQIARVFDLVEADLSKSKEQGRAKTPER